MNDAHLRTALLDLLGELGPVADRVLLGGGYGLYLKQLHVAGAGGETLIDAAAWPPPRGTSDLDLLLPAELIASVEEMWVVRSALDRLGFKPLEHARYHQFALPAPAGAARGVRVDLLAPQLSALRPFGDAIVVNDDRRARPRAGDRPDLHAWPTKGVLPVKAEPTVLAITGVTASGRPASGRVRVPHPLAYLLMKLTAYGSRRHQPRKDLGRHDAMDLFRIVAMTTREEDAEMPVLMMSVAEDEVVLDCRRLVATDFSDATAPGVTALRSHSEWPGTPEAEEAIGTFVESLRAYIVPRTRVQ